MNANAACSGVGSAGGDFGFEFVSQFELVFENIIDEISKLLLFLSRKIADGVGDFSECAHESKLKDLAIRSSVAG